jgi:hypothetical protein
VLLAPPLAEAFTQPCLSPVQILCVHHVQELVQRKLHQLHAWTIVEISVSYLFPHLRKLQSVQRLLSE